MSNNNTSSNNSPFTSSHTHTTVVPVWNSPHHHHHNSSITINNANSSIINEINNGINTSIDGCPYNFWDHRPQSYINSPGHNYRSEFMTHFPCTPEIWSTNATPSSNEFYRSQSVLQNTRMSKSSGSSNSKKSRRRVATLAQRRAANIRERRRMFNLNEAFDKLRRKVPTFAYEKRLSRIETLRLAITYISFMSELLNGNIDTENTAASVYHQHQGQREFIPYPPILH